MNLPRYSISQINRKAEDVISYFASEYLNNQKAVPVQSFVDRLHATNKLQFEISNLGFVGHNAKVLGLFIAHPECRLLIDASIVDSIRYNFTLAHELGHFVLHRKLDIGGDITDTSLNLNETPSALQTDRQWAEWQANNFAAAVLLPQRSFCNFITQNATKFELLVVRDCIVPQKTLRYQASIERLAEYAANNFDVSKTSVLIRMRKLNILV